MMSFKPVATAMLVAGVISFSTLASASVRCNELGLSVCLESRVSEVTSAHITWDDGTSTDLSAPNGTFTTYGSASLEDGYKTSLYSGSGLNSALIAYGGLGPAFQAAYEVREGPGTVAAQAGGFAYTPGQASSSFINGNTAPDPALSFVGNASSQFGVNKASASITGTVIGSYTADSSNKINPGHTGTATTRTLASGQSYWNDQVSFAGGSGSSTVNFSVMLDGSLDSYGFMWYQMYATDSSGHTQSVINEVVNGTSFSGSYSKSLTGSLSITPGMTYNLSGDLIVYAQTNGSGGTVTASENFSDTARVTSIGVPLGMTASFGSNSANLTGVVVAMAPVPESETWAMLMAGLGLIGWRARRRNA